MTLKTLFFICTVAALQCLRPAVAPGINMPPGMDAKGKRSDVKYIRCSACEQLAKQAYRMVKEMREEAKPGKGKKKLEEFAVIEKVEKLGNPSKDEGEWIAALDMVEDGKKIRLVEMEQMGKCGVECRTIQMAVDEILESADTDIAEKLFQGKTTRAQFQNWLCYEATSACSKKAPPVPADREKGPAFEPVDEKERSVQKMMESMKEMGMGGTVYNREQMMNQYKSLGGEDLDEDDEDDDDDAPAGEAAKADASGSATGSASEAATQKKPLTLGQRISKMVNKMGLGGGGGGADSSQEL